MQRYTIVPDASRLWIQARSSLHPIRVETAGVTGALEAERSADEVIRLGGGGHLAVAVRELRSGNELLDRETRRRVNVRRHPRIVGELRAVTPVGDGRFLLGGELSFHGVTRPVSGEVEVTADGEELAVSGSQQFDVRDWDLQPPRLLVLKVEPVVTVGIELHARL